MLKPNLYHASHTPSMSVSDQVLRGGGAPSHFISDGNQDLMSDISSYGSPVSVRCPHFTSSLLQTVLSQTVQTAALMCDVGLEPIHELRGNSDKVWKLEAELSDRAIEIMRLKYDLQVTESELLQQKEENVQLQRSKNAQVGHSPCSAQLQLVTAQEIEKLGTRISVLAEERDQLKHEIRRLSKTSAMKLGNNNRSKRREDRLYTSKELQACLARADDQWSRRIQTLKAQQEVVRLDYEEALNRAVVVNVKDRKPIVNQYNDRISANAENQVLQARVHELENRIECMKDFIFSKQKRSMQLYDRRSTCLTQTLPVVCIPQTAVAEATPAANPPNNTSLRSIDKILMSDWIDTMECCAVSLNRKSLSSRILQKDNTANKVGLIEVSDFSNCLHGLDVVQIHNLISIYSHGDSFIDYKTFLSDLATRSGIFIADLETENEVLRKHVNRLMRELSERMDSLENPKLIQALEDYDE